MCLLQARQPRGCGVTHDHHKHSRVPAHKNIWMAAIKIVARLVRCIVVCSAVTPTGTQHNITIWRALIIDIYSGDKRNTSQHFSRLQSFEYLLSVDMQIISTISTCPVRAGAGPRTHNCCTADTRLPGAQSCRARVSLQLQFAGIFRRCADILHTPESAVRCGPGTSWRLQLQWCNTAAASHSSPHLTPPACPRPEL